MNTNKLLQILQIQSGSYQQFRIFARIIREIRRIPGCGYHVKKGNIYVTKGKGEGYPCIVAHMDTVHDITDDLTAVTIGRNITGFNQVTMQQTGIGGDDKVGVFIALECLRLFDHIKAVFFRDEEMGCEGSYEADLTFFANCHFVLQCDRQGYRDFIVEAGGVELSSTQFQSNLKPLLDSFNYETTKGFMTDVMALKEIGVECSVANISCGYFNPHTDYEFVNIDCVERCLNLVMSILHQFGEIKFPHLPETRETWRQIPKSGKLQTLLCPDCWAREVTKTGYCESCSEYYDLLLK
jgi:tripeptide aminopeptidase